MYSSHPHNTNYVNLIINKVKSCCMYVNNQFDNMSNSKDKCTLKLYRGLCLLTAIILVSWCIYEYSLDRDVTEIKLQKFHESEDDLYPSITICNKSPFYRIKYLNHIKNTSIISLQDPNSIEEPGIIKAFNNFINGDGQALRNNGLLLKNSYTKLMRSLLELDYDKMTVGIDDLISKFEITIPVNIQKVDSLVYNMTTDYFELNELESLLSQSYDEFKVLKTYVSARFSNYKCFSLDIPIRKQVQVRKIALHLNASVFPFGLSPTQFYFTLTYPKQFMHASQGKQIRIPPGNRARCYKFEVFVGSMKVFRRRDRSISRCNIDWRHHDEQQLKHIFDQVGCNPKHWKIESHLPHCTTPEQFLELNYQLQKKDGYMPPCRSIEKLSKRTLGKEMWRECLSSRSKSYLDLQFYLDEESFYEEVILSPAYSLQNLVGNSGKIRPISIHQGSIKIIKST